MTAKPTATAELGDLVVAAFDAAGRLSADPTVVSRLATAVVLRVLRTAARIAVQTSVQGPTSA